VTDRVAVLQNGEIGRSCRDHGESQQQDVLETKFHAEKECCRLLKLRFQRFAKKKLRAKMARPIKLQRVSHLKPVRWRLPRRFGHLKV
jgi:hypothetical protein